MKPQQKDPAEISETNLTDSPYHNLDSVSYSSEAISEQTQPSITSILHTEILTGPLPHPDLLRGYDNIIPNGAERIMRIAEKEQDSLIQERNETRKDNKEISLAKINLIKRGQNMGFALAIALLGLATLFVLTGHETFAYILFSVGAISMIGLFVNPNKDIKKSD